MRFRVAMLACILPLACGGDGPGRWAGTVDTLDNGAILVVNPAEGLWRGGEGWTLEEELRIGSAMSMGPDLFGNVTGVVVDDEDRLHVLDRQARELRTFGPDGRHVRTVGREGSGPGEFKDVIGLALTPDGDRLVIADPGNARYAVYSTDGEYLTVHRRNIGGYALPWAGGFGADGQFYEQIPAGVVQFDTAFESADTLEFPGYAQVEGSQFVLRTEYGTTTVPVPFSSVQSRKWDPRGYLWTGVSGDYTLTQMSLQGDTVRIIRRTGVPTDAVTAAERDEALERLDWFTQQGGRVDPSAVPSRKPYFTSFHLATDGHVWVRLSPRPEEEGARYDVFDPEGRYLGEVQSPTFLGWAPLIRDSAIYAVTADSLGVEYVVRLRLRHPSP